MQSVDTAAALQGVVVAGAGGIDAHREGAGIEVEPGGGRVHAEGDAVCEGSVGMGAERHGLQAGAGEIQHLEALHVVEIAIHQHHGTTAASDTQGVVARATDHGDGGIQVHGAGEQHGVVVSAAIDHVGTAKALDQVVAGAAVERVGPQAAPHVVDAIATLHGEPSGASSQGQIDRGSGCGGIEAGAAGIAGAGRGHKVAHVVGCGAGAGRHLQLIACAEVVHGEAAAFGAEAVVTGPAREGGGAAAVAQDVAVAGARDGTRAAAHHREARCATGDRGEIQRVGLAHVDREGAVGCAVEGAGGRRPVRRQAHRGGAGVLDARQHCFIGDREGGAGCHRHHTIGVEGHPSAGGHHRAGAGDLQGVDGAEIGRERDAIGGEQLGGDVEVWRQSAEVGTCGELQRRDGDGVAGAVDGGDEIGIRSREAERCSVHEVERGDAIDQHGRFSDGHQVVAGDRQRVDGGEVGAEAAGHSGRQLGADAEGCRQGAEICPKAVLKRCHRDGVARAVDGGQQVGIGCREAEGCVAREVERGDVVRQHRRFGDGEQPTAAHRQGVDRAQIGAQVDGARAVQLSGDGMAAGDAGQVGGWGGLQCGHRHGAEGGEGAAHHITGDGFVSGLGGGEGERFACAHLEAIHLGRNEGIGGDIQGSTALNDGHP